MNWPHVHLMINHFPIILSMVGAGAAILGAIMRRRMIWTFAAICLTLAGAAVWPVFISGKQASDAIEDLVNPPRTIIHAHEESSEIALVIVLGAGIIGSIAWWQLSRAGTEEPRRWLRWATIVAALAAAATTGYTALLGGRIYHGPAGNARPAAWDSVSVTNQTTR